MNHLSDAQLYSLVFDPVRPTQEEAAHVEECTQCRSQLTTLGQFATELAIARQSEPTAPALVRYAELFSHVQQTPSLLARMVQNLRATLTWDSRQPLMLQGVRSAAATNYRQLYTTERAEIEWLVTVRTSQRRDIEGEIMLAEDEAQATPVLLQLQAHGEGQASYEAESDGQGRFRISNVAPGRYQLLLTLQQGALLEMNELEIA